MIFIIKGNVNLASSEKHTSYLYKNNSIPTFDGGIEYGSFSDFD